MKKMKLPPGLYLIIDPCYVLKGQLWENTIQCIKEKQWARKESKKESVFSLEGLCQTGNPRKMAVLGTQYGDGSYKGISELKNDRGLTHTLRFEIGVDSGQISCIPIGDPDKTMDKTTEFKTTLLDILEADGRIELFEKDFEVSYEDGLIKFGHISIQT